MWDQEGVGNVLGGCFGARPGLPWFHNRAWDDSKGSLKGTDTTGKKVEKE